MNIKSVGVQLILPSQARRPMRHLLRIFIGPILSSMYIEYYHNVT